LIYDPFDFAQDKFMIFDRMTVRRVFRPDPSKDIPDRSALRSEIPTNH